MPARDSSSTVLADRRVGRRGLLAAVSVPAAALLASGLSATPASADSVGVGTTQTTLAQLRAMTGAPGTGLYLLTDAGMEGFFGYDPGDSTSADNTGTVVVTAGGARMKRVTDGQLSVRWFGAVGDGTTDDTDAVRLAVAAGVELGASVSRPILFFPPSAGYLVSDTITVGEGVDMQMDGALTYAGPADRPALLVGGTSDNSNGRLKLNVNHASGAGNADWSNEEAVGIRLYNCHNCVIDIVQANGFAIGVQCIGDSSGFVFNEVHLGQLISNKIGLDLTNRNSGPGIGWCNENIFYNGQFQQYSNTNPGQSRIGLRVTSMDGTYVGNNNNILYKPCFQLWQSGAAPGEALPILIEHGQLNRIESLRTESNGPYVMRVLNESTRNVVDVGYGAAAVDDQSTYPATESAARALLTDFPAMIFDSGAVHESACYYDGSASVQVPRVGFGSYYSSTPGPAGRAVLAGDYLEMTGTSHDAIGVNVDTSVNKRFVLKADTTPGHGGRVYIACYDASGSQLVDLGTDPGSAYVRTQQTATVYWNGAAFGGSYLTQSDHDNIDFFFSLSGDVAMVRVMLWKGTASLQLRSFSLYALDSGSPTVTSGCGRPNDERLAIAPPTQGAWPRGLFLRNAEPAAAGPAGAQYVITGWQKVSDATSNTLGTDWVEARVLTGG